jgi:hypothetical protein
MSNNINEAKIRFKLTKLPQILDPCWSLRKNTILSQTSFGEGVCAACYYYHSNTKQEWT